MRKIVLLLILLSIFIVSFSLMAQDEHHLNLKEKDPTQESSATPTARDNFDSWEGDRKIKDSFLHLRTVHIYHDDQMDVEVGAAQVKFHFAL